MLSAQFNDYDAYFETIERVDALFTMQTLEQRLWQIDGLVLPSGITLQHCCSGSGALAQGVGARDGVELAIPAAGSFTANGEEVPPGAALLLGAAQEFMVSIPGSHRWFNVFVPEAMVSSAGLTGGGENIPQPGTSSILGNQSQAPLALVSLLMKFLSRARATPEIPAGAATLESFQAELVGALRQAYGVAPGRPDHRLGRPPTIDRARILLAVDAIEASPEPAMSISDLAQVCQLPERSLRAGFRKYLGLSPSRYMQLRTLHRARQQLADSAPGETTVARVAADLGIWDLGRFATRYRALFGELPSATLGSRDIALSAEST